MVPVDVVDVEDVSGGHDPDVSACGKASISKSKSSVIISSSPSFKGVDKGMLLSMAFLSELSLFIDSLLSLESYCIEENPRLVSRYTLVLIAHEKKLESLGLNIRELLLLFFRSAIRDSEIGCGYCFYSSAICCLVTSLLLGT